MPGIKDWLRKASSDLKAAKKLSDDDETFDCSVFHTHQCAEMADSLRLVLANSLLASYIQSLKKLAAPAVALAKAGGGDGNRTHVR